MKNTRKHNSDRWVTDEIPDDVGITSHGGSGVGKKPLHEKDSHIHIVKPVEGVVPSTPLSTDSKIIEIKPSTHRNNVVIKKVKRSEINSDGDSDSDISDTDIEDNEYEDEISPNFKASAAPLIGAVPGNISAAPIYLDGLAGCIQKYLNINKEIGMMKVVFIKRQT